MIVENPSNPEFQCVRGKWKVTRERGDVKLNKIKQISETF